MDFAIQVLLTTSSLCLLSTTALKTPLNTRIFLLPPLIISSYYALSVAAELPYTISHRYALSVILYILHNFSILYLPKYQLERRTWKEAWYMQFNGRWLFSPRSTAFPSASAKSSRSKGKVSVEVQHIVQTRKSKFIAAILIYIFMCLYYDILDLATLLEPGQGKNPAIQTTFIRRLLFPSTSPEIPITTRELLSRSWHTIGTFIIEPLILTSIHHIFAILSISLGLDSAADWPQFFGDITECYTVRNFWGKFWHRMIYRCTTCYTVLICDVIFGGHEKDGVRRNRGEVERLVRNWFVFVASAVVHAVATVVVNGKGTWSWGEFIWFSAQPLAFAAESAVFGVWRGLGMKSPVFERIAGYLWVFLFFFWSLPKKIL